MLKPKICLIFLCKIYILFCKIHPFNADINNVLFMINVQLKKYFFAYCDF